MTCGTGRTRRWPVTMTDRCWPVLSAGIGSTVAPMCPRLVPVRCGRGPARAERGLLVRPEGHGATGRFQDRSGVDLGSRLRDASDRPLTDEGERPRRWQRPHPMLHVPGRAATACTVLVEHRPIRLLFWVVGGPVKVGGLTTVGELHPEAEELHRGAGRLRRGRGPAGRGTAAPLERRGCAGGGRG
jgi:hypothetical protein